MANFERRGFVSGDQRSVDTNQAVHWADHTVERLTGTRAIGAYLEWKERIRELVVHAD